MHALPVDDLFAKGRVREDGRHDFFLAEVKAPSESIAPWDYYKIRRIIPAQEAAQPLAQSKCSCRLHQIARPDQMITAEVIVALRETPGNRQARNDAAGECQRLVREHDGDAGGDAGASGAACSRVSRQWAM